MPTSIPSSRRRRRIKEINIRTELIVKNMHVSKHRTGITHEQALRLYTAIDGRKTVDELRSTGMTLKGGHRLSPLRVP